MAFFDTSMAPSRLSVFQNLVFAQDSTILYGGIILNGGATLHVGGGSRISVPGDLRLESGSTLLLQGKNTSIRVAGEWRGEGVSIDARNVTVNVGARITADGQGYAGTAGPGAGESDPLCNASAAGGGAGGAAIHVSGGAAYGSARAPAELGSGNSPPCNITSIANAGGGAVFLGARELLQLDGAITADAATNLPERLGGGAGGSLYVIARRVAGSGRFSTDGTSAGSVSAGGGAGGRIAVYFLEGSALGFAATTATGGTGHAAGEGGTVLFAPTPPGDANCDGETTAADPIALLRLLANGERAFCAADDADGDGSLGAPDFPVMLGALFGRQPGPHARPGRGGRP